MLIQEVSSEKPNDTRLSALTTMAIIADQSRDQRTGISNALEGRETVIALPLSQLIDILVAIAVTESLEQGVSSARLAVYGPGERPNRYAVSLPSANIQRGVPRP